jgi:hypothetical protein
VNKSLTREQRPFAFARQRVIVAPREPSIRKRMAYLSVAVSAWENSSSVRSSRSGVTDT